MATGVDVLESILNDGTASTSTTDARKEAQKVYQHRIEGKKVQLGNLDRSRPIPKVDSLAHRQIEKRTKRVMQRYKHSISRGKGKGKGSSTLSPKSKRILKREDERPLSRREREELDLDQTTKEKEGGRGQQYKSISFDSLLPIHKLWTGYIQRLLGFKDEHGQDQSNQLVVVGGSQQGNTPIEVVNFHPSAISGFQTSLVKADMCGSMMRVIRALNPSLVGIEGIVAKETESTFVIVTEPPINGLGKAAKPSQKCIKVIPKENAVFSLRIPLPSGAIPSSTNLSNGQFEVQVPIYGNQFGNSMQTRATKKYKARRTIDL